MTDSGPLLLQTLHEEKRRRGEENLQLASEELSAIDVETEFDVLQWWCELGRAKCPRQATHVIAKRRFPVEKKNILQ